MNRGINALTTLVFIAALVSQCETPTPQPIQPRPSDTPDTSIGTIQHVSDFVEWNESQVVDTAPLHNNDRLRLYQQGEGLLDIRGKARFRVFNTTQLGGITAEAAPGTPWLIRMWLEVGGGTGEFAEPGGSWEIATPSGAKITIFGTRFFVIYDPNQQVMIAGNYDGSMEMDAGGSLVPILPDSYAWSTANSQPVVTSPIPLSIGNFERQARTNGTVVGVIRARVGIIPAATLPVDITGPAIQRITMNPPDIGIGRECPNATGTTQVTVGAADESGILEVRAFWENGGKKGEIVMNRVDDFTFTAMVGPAVRVGEMTITIIATDTAGNRSELTTVVKVYTCIG